jgi:hypothetical protein
MCMAGFCCSPRGYCGDTEAHCSGAPYVEPEDYDLFRDRLNFTRCGEAYGNCTREDECCDEYGFCGTGDIYDAGYCSNITLDIVITVPTYIPNASNVTNSTMDDMQTMMPVDDEDDEEEPAPTTAAPGNNYGGTVNTQQKKSGAVAVSFSPIFIIAAAMFLLA